MLEKFGVDPSPLHRRKRTVCLLLVVETAAASVFFLQLKYIFSGLHELYKKKKKSLGWGVAFKGHHVTGRLAGAVEVTDSVEFLLRPKNWGQRHTARERTRRGPGKHNHPRKQNRKMTARTGRSEGKQARRCGCESARTFSFEGNLAAHIKSLCILVLKFHVQALPFRHSQ